MTDELPAASSAQSAQPERDSQPTQRQRGALTRVVAWLELHPIAKLIAYIWILVSAAGTVMSSYEQFWAGPRRAATISGSDRAPMVRISFGAEECRLVNTDKIDIKEVSIGFNTTVIRASSRHCAADSSLYKPWEPSAATHMLQPREAVTATPAKDLWRYMADNPGGDPCPVPSEGCVRIIECHAVFHRASDLQAFEMSRYVALVPSRLIGPPLLDPKEARSRPQNVISDVGILADLGLRDLAACFAGGKRLKPSEETFGPRQVPSPRISSSPSN